MDDQVLLTLLTTAFDAVGDVPAHLHAAALSAIELRDIDSELADLVFDSWRVEQEAVMRTTMSDTRMLSFSTAELTVDLEVRDDGTVLGQVDHTDDGARDAPRSGRVDIDSGSASATTVGVNVDDAGRFRGTIERRSPFRIRVGDTFVTPWIT